MSHLSLLEQGRVHKYTVSYHFKKHAQVDET